MEIKIVEKTDFLLLYAMSGLPLEPFINTISVVLTTEEDDSYRMEYDIIEYIKKGIFDTEILSIPVVDLIHEDTLYQIEFIINGTSSIIHYLRLVQSRAQVQEIADNVKLTFKDESNIHKIEYVGTHDSSKVMVALTASATMNSIYYKVLEGKNEEAYESLKKLKNELNLWIQI